MAQPLAGQPRSMEDADLLDRPAKRIAVDQDLAKVENVPLTVSGDAISNVVRHPSYLKEMLKASQYLELSE